MPLPSGSRLGSYEILSPLGAGGMGEVYRARDSKLGREVAIKVLPPAFADDAERLARFKREAQLLAALNHPKIAAIYGLDEAAGQPFLVMELVPGEDLSERLKRGAMPVDDALAVARQIAEALEDAHEKGIVHRDLKPANIKLTSDGQVKVLDFGLAKALDDREDGRQTADGGLSLSPTLTARATQLGVILGTAAYMSPEQARGKPVDRRADIWAFGAMLYEMLTGQRAFPGEDVTDTLAAVVRAEPEWSLVPRDVSPTLLVFLRRSLHKDPKQRVGDIRDVRLALEGAFETAVPPSPSGTRTTSAAVRALPYMLAVSTVVFAIAWLTVWAPWRAPTPVDRPLVRLDVDLGPDVSLPAPGSAGSHVAISPDGARLVYASGNPTKLYIRRLDQPTATELPGTEGAQGPFFSPDGQWVGFVARGKLSKISVEGGAAVPLSDTSNFLGASWGEDGSIILGSALDLGLLRLPSGGGAPETVAPLGNGEAALARPQVLPGGKAVLFTVSTSGSVGGVGRFNIEVLTLADHHRKIVARGGSTARYLPTSTGVGHLVYTSNATLFAIPFDLEKLETRGTAIPVLDDVAYSDTIGAGGLDFSRTGTLVYRRAGASAAVSLSTLQWVDAAGRKEPLRATPGVYLDPRLSPDGKRVALLFSDGGLPDVWVYDAQRDIMTRLTFVRSTHISPIWSPDSQYVVFAKFPTGIFSTRADGASQPEALTQDKSNVMIPWSFTPDGKRLAYFERAGTHSQLWTVPLESQGGRLKAGTPEPFLKSSFNDQAPSFSPDGRWLAYQSDESGKNEVCVRAFPPPASGQGGKWQISNSGGTDPRWSPNGRELLYRSGDQIMTASYAVQGDAFLAEKPRVWIAKLGAAAILNAREWDLAPDGKRVAVVTPVGSALAPKQEHTVVFLQNFFDELRRRVPAGK